MGGERRGDRHEVEADSSTADGRTRLSLEAFDTPQGRGRSVDDSSLDMAARAINKACKGLGTDEEAVYQALKGKTPADLAYLSDSYQRQYGLTLDSQLRAEMSGEELDTALELLNRRPEKMYASAVDLRRTLRVLNDLDGADALSSQAIFNGVAKGDPIQAAAGAATRTANGSARALLEGQIMKMAEGMSGSDVQKLSAEYRRIYGDDLMKDARDVLSQSSLSQLKERGWPVSER